VSVPIIADPRVFPAQTAADADPALRLARAVLDAGTADTASAAEAALADWAIAAAGRGDARAVVAVLDAAPSVDVYRVLWRVLHRAAPRTESAELTIGLFAIPIVLVVGAESPATLAGVVPAPARLCSILVERRMVGGSRNLSLGNALVGAGQLAIGRVLDLALRSTLESLAQELAREPLVPEPLRVAAGREQAHLRFLVGSAFAGPKVKGVASSASGSDAMALTRELTSQLASTVATVLPLAGVPEPLLAASHRGFVAHREVAFQLFLGTAVRDFRGRYGEPTACVSAHRLERGRGELRVTLGSGLADGVEQGFRYPLHPLERVNDALEAVLALLADCRIGDIRVAPEVYPDLDPATARTLLIGPERFARARALALR